MVAAMPPLLLELWKQWWRRWECQIDVLNLPVPSVVGTFGTGCDVIYRWVRTSLQCLIVLVNVSPIGTDGPGSLVEHGTFFTSRN